MRVLYRFYCFFLDYFWNVLLFNFWRHVLCYLRKVQVEFLFNLNFVFLNIIDINNINLFFFC